MKVYKIRNKEGLFSTGGLAPSWKKIGKTWVALQHINSHLTMVRQHYAYYKAVRFPYIDCTVIEYVTEENAVGTITEEGKIQLEYVNGGPKQ